MKWDSALKVLQISDYKGETAKPKPFIKGMLETINQSYFYIESLIVKNFSRSRQRPQSTSGTLQEYWYDVSFQLNPGKVEIGQLNDDHIWLQRPEFISVLLCYLNLSIPLRIKEQ